jgi:hypothetical protein
MIQNIQLAKFHCVNLVTKNIVKIMLIPMIVIVIIRNQSKHNCLLSDSMKG